MATEIPRCACGCGAALIRRGKSGPAPQYASAVCRKRAERRRRATQFKPLPDAVHADRVPVGNAPADDQIANALIEIRAAAFALLRLGPIARPELGWRCTKLGEAILAALERSFGKGIK